MTRRAARCTTTGTAFRAGLRAAGAALGLALAVTGAVPALGDEAVPRDEAVPSDGVSPSAPTSAGPSSSAAEPGETADETAPPPEEGAAAPETPGTPSASEPQPQSETAPEPQRREAAVVADPSLAISAPAWAYIDTEQSLTVTLTDGKAPVEGTEVLVQRWRPALEIWASTTYTTDANGQATHVFRVRRDSNRFRAKLAEDRTITAGPVDVQARRIPTKLTVGGDTSVVDERRATLDIGWVAGDGRKVTGPVELYRRTQGTTQWSLVRRLTVKDGAVAVRVRPREDTVWRAEGAAGVWYAADASGLHRIDNVPPGRPVVLPAGAPRPSITLPAQRRAVGAGLNAKVTRIPKLVWRSMVGRSWHRGCPVGRRDLRLVTLNYWGFDGYRHRGELVLSTSAAGPAVNTFGTLYDGRYPIRAMYRVDRFGWSRKLGGANDYKSMAADNTSGFNCRQVVGRPGVMSPHAYGGSIDINPWENPYVSRQGTYPNTWWLSRSHPRYAWRSWSHPVVTAFTSQGFAWGGAYRDYHHFQR